MTRGFPTSEIATLNLRFIPYNTKNSGKYSEFTPESSFTIKWLNFSNPTCSNVCRVFEFSSFIGHPKKN